MFTATQPIRDIVAESSSAAEILARFEIDSLRCADQNLEQACSAAQLSVDQILEKLEDAALGEPGAAPPDPTGFTLTRLIQHIVRVHHRYLRERLPQLIALARVTAQDSPQTSAWQRIPALLEELRASMALHFEKEEQVLFPYIAQIDDDHRWAYLPPNSSLRTMSEMVFVMAQEHEFIDRGLKKIEHAVSSFSPTESDGAACREFAERFRAVKSDIEAHVHLEDYNLFPRAIRVELAATQRG